MKKMMGHIERAAHIVNLPHLIKREWTEREAIDIYDAVKHMFMFPSLKKRRYGTIVWKTYYNLLVKRKGVLLGEQQTNN